ncbi:unnamed protein product [Closterium sp. NIES-54]
MSAEVLACTRGDLLPDPALDALCCVVLATQGEGDGEVDGEGYCEGETEGEEAEEAEEGEGREESGRGEAAGSGGGRGRGRIRLRRVGGRAQVDVLILEETPSDICRRNPDALSSCRIHLLSSESALLERVVAVVREYDPDILLGWDVQGASWGWLVERAQHLCFTQPVSSAPIPSPNFHLRNPDALSSCRIHLLSSEVALLECLVAVVRQYDPDILLGWEVQGGSWGWLAERAQHLGFNLLKSLSRVPPVHDVRVAQARAPFKCDTPEAPASSVPPALVQSQPVQSQPVQSQPVQSHPAQSHTPQSHPAQPIPLQSPHAAVTSELPLDSQDISATPLQSQRHLSPSFPPMGPSQSPVSPPLATAPPDAALSDAVVHLTTVLTVVVYLVAVLLVTVLLHCDR